MENQTTLERDLHLIASHMMQISMWDKRVAELLTLSVGRVLAKLAKRGEDWRAAYEAADVTHIKDWLKVATINDDPWLKHCDAKGRPRKLMKFSTIEQITQEADKAMMKANQKLQGIRLAEGEEKLISELEDGYYIVELLTPTALDREGSIMQHCVGQGAYDDDVASGDIKILSLRDQYGKPHATIELSVPETAVFHNYEIAQIQGKQNKFPLDSYLQLLGPYLLKNTQNFTDIASSAGYVVTQKGRLLKKFDIPENSTIIDFEYHGSKDIELPKGLVIKGKLDISRSSISSIPDDIIIEGNLVVVTSKCTKLPDNLKVGGNLMIGYTNHITDLPKGLKVGGGILLQKLKIKAIPDDLQVGKYLKIQNCDIQEPIPASIKIGGDLRVEGWSNIRFADGISVPNLFEIKDYSFKTLPNGLACKTLDIKETSVQTVSEDAKISNLLCDLNKFDVTSLPDSFSDRVLCGPYSFSTKSLGQLRQEARAKLDTENSQGMSI